MTNEEFENEIVDYWKSTELSKSITLGKFKSIARYFYGLGLGSSEKPNNHLEDLDEAAREAATEVYTYSFQGMDDLIGLFKAGAKWQKEQDDKELSEKIAAAYQLGLADKEKQMMKDAVEGDIGMILHDKTADLFVRSKGYLPKSLGIKCDDKVRIIIVKLDKHFNK